MAQKHRFTIFDALDAQGYFDANPANPGSRNTEGMLYQGPVEYPKMFYHPQGDQRVTVPGEAISTPFGPKIVGEQKELIWKIAQNAEDEAKLLAEGWHDHPAKAIAAAGDPTRPVPPKPPTDRIRELEAQIAALQAQQAEWAKPAPKGPGPGPK